VTVRKEKQVDKMKKLRKKEEIAEYIKVSLPVLNKFLKRHKSMVDSGRINIRELNKIINKESARLLSKKGK